MSTQYACFTRCLYFMPISKLGMIPATTCRDSWLLMSKEACLSGKRDLLMGTRGLLMRRGLAYLSIYRSRIPGSVTHEYREADSRLRHTTRITPTTPATPTGATHPNYPINFQANYPYSTYNFYHLPTGACGKIRSRSRDLMRMMHGLASKFHSTIPTMNTISLPARCVPHDEIALSALDANDPWYDGSSQKPSWCVSGTCTCQKRPIHVAKEACLHGKAGLEALAYCRYVLETGVASVLLCYMCI
jgi:hypothetical protein